MPYLQMMGSLRVLHLNDTEISDVSVLLALPRVAKLFLDGTFITSISALDRLVGLTHLHLSYTQV